MGEIDVNRIDGDILEEHFAPDNEDTVEMLNRLTMEELGISPKELYLRGILGEVKSIMAKGDKKSPAESEKLLKYLQAIDNVCGFSKDKRDVKIVTQMGSMSDIFNKIKD